MMKKIVTSFIVGVIIAANLSLFAGCNNDDQIKWKYDKIEFNAVIIKNGFRQTFLDENPIYLPFIDNSKGDELPESRTFILETQEQADECFDYYPKTDFEKEIIIVYTYAIYNETELKLHSLVLDENILEIEILSEWFSNGETPQPMQKAIGIKMDKVEFDDIHIDHRRRHYSYHSDSTSYTPDSEWDEPIINFNAEIIEQCEFSQSFLDENPVNTDTEEKLSLGRTKVIEVKSEKQATECFSSYPKTDFTEKMIIIYIYAGYNEYQRELYHVTINDNNLHVRFKATILGKCEPPYSLNTLVIMLDKVDYNYTLVGCYFEPLKFDEDSYADYYDFASNIVLVEQMLISGNEISE